jgi:hypothetical protein
MCSLVGQPGVSDLGWKASDASKSGEGGAKGKGGGWRGPHCAGAWGAPKHVRVGRREVGASMRFAIRVEEERIRGKDCWRIYTFLRGQIAKQTRRTYQPTDGRFSVLFVERLWASWPWVSISGGGTKKV